MLSVAKHLARWAEMLRCTQHDNSFPGYYQKCHPDTPLAILSAAKDLLRRAERSFAALRMTKLFAQHDNTVLSVILLFNHGVSLALVLASPRHVLRP